ncbi:MAG: T9SS type A sorting domain-containing protein [Bacteroidales bacterium]|nr:T9SS type A sorting domain-containing protein [Bacteroidales bacterium]
MKKMLLLSAMFLVVVNLSFAQPAIPNGGFENWTDTITPQSWGTSNLNLGFFTYAGVTRTTDKYTGTYAMKLKTISIPMVGMMPAIATTGTFNMMVGITGGVPTGGIKPIGFNGAFKYTSVNGDTMAIFVILTRWNGTTRDTLGYGGIATNQSVNNYTTFNQPIQYDIPNQIPDTFNIILASSAGYVAQENSTLFVDNLSFIASSGEVIPLSAMMQRVYPNPSNGKFTIALGDEENYQIRIYNLLGQIVWEASNIFMQTEVNMEGMPKGLYLIEIDNGQYKRTHRITIE